MLREEQDVGADEGDPEVQLADALGIDVTGDRREPVLDGGEDPVHGDQRQHVVKVSQYVVGVVHVSLQGSCTNQPS
jgi:hypothetical protein